MILSNYLVPIIKYIILFFLFYNSIFIDFIFINNKYKQIIEIDNELQSNSYEIEDTFDNEQKKLKVIAFYYPEYNNFSFSQYFDDSEKSNFLNNDNIKQTIEAQIKLAKRHGIYGFAIYFNLFKWDYYNDLTVNLFLNKISFPFFLIWRNDELGDIDTHHIVYFIEKIKPYMLSDNYIQIEKKPVLSIQNPYKYLNIHNLLSAIRKEAKKKIKSIFIFYPFTGNFNEKLFLKEFDATYDFSKIDLFKHKTNNNNILYYSGFVYKNLILNELNFDYPVFRTCYLNNKKYKD